MGAASIARGSERTSVRRRLAVIADDLHDAREILAAVLQRAGFDVVEASDGRALLAAIEELGRQRRTLDVIIADIDMPGIDGIEAARQARQLAPAVPIVLITGLRDEKTVARASVVGARAIMQRPFDPAELVALLDELIAPVMAT
ncbi:MAG TPA: response regulator [Polyangiales bacterium]